MIDKINSASLTNLNQKKIKHSFSKAARRYDGFADLQKDIAVELCKDYIVPLSSHQFPLSRILDIGCGTGFLTNELRCALPDASIIGCDISPFMTKVAKDKIDKSNDSKKVHFISGDGAILSYKPDVFDMVTSNLTYQWVSDMQASFSEAKRVLRLGGVLVFSTIGPDTFKELRLCYNNVLEITKKNGLPPFIEFMDIQILISLLEGAGFKNISVVNKTIIKNYRDMWSLLKTIKSIGAGNPFKEGDKSLSRGALLKKMAEEYKDNFKVTNLDMKGTDFSSQGVNPEDICATYEILFVYGLLKV